MRSIWMLTTAILFLASSFFSAATGIRCGYRARALITLDTLPQTNITNGFS